MKTLIIILSTMSILSAQEVDVELIGVTINGELRQFVKGDGYRTPDITWSYPNAITLQPDSAIIIIRYPNSKVPPNKMYDTSPIAKAKELFRQNFGWIETEEQFDEWSKDKIIEVFQDGKWFNTKSEVKKLLM